MICTTTKSVTVTTEALACVASRLMVTAGLAIEPVGVERMAARSHRPTANGPTSLLVLREQQKTIVIKLNEATPSLANDETGGKWRWCTDRISRVSAYVAAIENSLIDHPCHTNITPLAVITSGR